MHMIAQTLAQELKVSVQHVENVIALLDEGATLPFIARYRKEQHGSLDDQQLRDISDRLNALRNIELGDSDPKLSNVLKIAGALQIDMGMLNSCIPILIEI